ncbi:ubiquitin-conjugating enzyme E2-34 kDa [Kluyveromyces marxianus]|uniref:Ubiquitin-conjugating enzyme E2-34 kDa n=2 Tax=Kluyveromyces marxianus TaxID=4911 RepID=W0TAN6_KLUMD|nr:ubiquitin-conjugating enzyme E2-34 kDa [Kluyveromyces marxianus DMKU3-1042]QGN14892.1 ubiquitin-conjugating enzyme E2-34 kDa [Kluyveromyces marxianus]BAO39164.1 ubiquitin-conjugating enzyme E2-34 kDa [Kluyveromyces marxianus DMKU3-1042]BAP70683.1 ubiquitin-conjugating enzyme E2-34 kDa [Kluyveromyces marxianus]
MSRKNTAASLLLRQYRELTDPKKAIPSFHIELEDDSNIFLWNIGVMVLNEESIYHGGYFKAQMKFPDDFPFSPPTFRFTPAIYHPNVYRDGRLCISILHQSGNPTSDEPDEETWSPVQTVESVLISIVSLLEDPNISSPANVDAAVDYKKNPEQYKQKVKLEVERSKQDIPQGFVMPESTKAYVSQRRANEAIDSIKDTVGDNFWYDSDEGEEDVDIYAYEDSDEDEEEDDEDQKLDGASFGKDHSSSRLNANNGKNDIDSDDDEDLVPEEAEDSLDESVMDRRSKLIEESEELEDTEMK